MSKPFLQWFPSGMNPGPDELVASAAYRTGESPAAIMARWDRPFHDDYIAALLRCLRIEPDFPHGPFEDSVDEVADQIRNPAGYYVWLDGIGGKPLDPQPDLPDSP